ncbi:MAG TPA: metallophosphoesterase family protein [Polyangiaceae bacterium]
MVPEVGVSQSGRTVVVGDVHGCSDELERLLELVQFEDGDALYFLGDMLSRGPDPEAVLALFRRTRARGVRGNHDDALLRWHARRREGGPELHLGRANQKLALQLEPADWEALESLALYIELPSHDLVLVHAGLIPGVALEAQPLEALLSMRYLGPNNEPIEKGGSILWGARYVGPPHVLFGHNAGREVQLHEWATGIDTGAVYGQRLTAVVLDPGAKMPPIERRSEVLFSVPSRARYYVPR